MTDSLRYRDVMVAQALVLGAFVLPGAADPLLAIGVVVAVAAMFAPVPLALSSGIGHILPVNQKEARP